MTDRHNHMTRDIKRLGECPACDLYLWGHCRHCGAKIAYVPGHSGRYRFTDRMDGTDIFGSGSECPRNERGHEPVEMGDDRGMIGGGRSVPPDSR